MKIILKNHYKHLIENKKDTAYLQGWHDAYSEFYNEVGKMRKRMSEKKGQGLSEADEDFLWRLLCGKDNGITSRGQSILSKENFKLFIESEGFMSALQQFIMTPNKEHFQKFEKSWSDTAQQHKAKNNPLLVNRVAAACTLKVSTTVDPIKFNIIFNWLIDKNIIPAYSEEKDQDWYSKNTFLLKIIKDEFSDELKEEKTDKFYLSQFVWMLYANISNPFSLQKQIVKYGAPGTGKTYQARQQTSLRFDIWKEEFAPNSSLTHASRFEQVQFHPSFSYEDFIEGLRPVLDDNGASQLTLQNGIFKKFCRNAGKWEMDVYGLGLDLDWESITILELHSHREKLTGDHWQYIFEISDSSKSKLVSDAVPPFFFIIDEVNRAELSRVFGELMYCLEYRGIEGGVKTQYANLNNEHTGMLQTDQGYLFFIPTNVYLIGTMNTIDRSVESFDFALRRRFHWEEVTPNTDLLKYYLRQLYKKWKSQAENRKSQAENWKSQAENWKSQAENWEPLADNLQKLNTRITEEPLLGSDYQIGHAYLMKLKYGPLLYTEAEVRRYVWDGNIRPLLQEYLRGTGKEAELIGSFGKAFGV